MIRRRGYLAARAVEPRPHRAVKGILGMPRWIALCAKLAVGVVLMGLAASTVDWTQFREAVRHVVPAWLALVGLMGFLDRAWMAGKWLYLLRGLNVGAATFGQALWHYFRGGLVGIGVQWQLGGDIARALGLGHLVGKKQVVMASLVFEKVAGASANGLVATASLALLILTVDVGPLMPALLLGLCIVALTVLFPLLALSRPVRATVYSVLSLLPLSTLQRFRHVTDAVESVLSKRRVGLVFFLLTLGEQIVPFINILLLSRAFHLELTMVEMFMVIPVATFFSRLPISIESVGVREGLYVALFSLFGVSAAEAFAMALAVRVIDFVVVGAGTSIGFIAGRSDGSGVTSQGKLSRSASDQTPL